MYCCLIRRKQRLLDLMFLSSTISICSQSKIHFESINSRSPLAYIVENDAMASLLSGRITETCPNVTVRDCAKVVSCRVPSDLSENAQITLSDGSVIESSLLIGADGAKSSVRQAMGVNYASQDYDQMAIVGTLKVSHAKDSLKQIAWQRFTPTGPIALLPLTDELSSLFVDELNNHMKSDVQQDSMTNKALFLMNKLCAFLPRASSGQMLTLKFPMCFGYVDDYVASRAALIGDAAHKVHPLAGQGVNLGWHDVQCLVEALETAVNEGADLGSLTYLRDYDTKSQRHNVPVMRAIDGLNRLYRTDFGPYVFLRSVGVHALDKLLPIKDLIMHRAEKNYLKKQKDGTQPRKLDVSAEVKRRLIRFTKKNESLELEGVEFVGKNLSLRQKKTYD
uniref:FAD-binding domain-containing protein n=1 Tax=Ditylenchus dipsaci TaxID=166011 RepID=A0A915E4B6_9BILA